MLQPRSGLPPGELCWRWAGGPRSAPASCSRAGSRRGDGAQAFGVCWLVGDACFPCARPARGRARQSTAPAPLPGPSALLLPFPRCAPRQVAGAGAICGFALQLLLRACSVSSELWEKVLLQRCEGVEQFSSTVQHLHCSLWHLDPPRNTINEKS